MAAIKGKRTVKRNCIGAKIHPNQVTGWKEHLLQPPLFAAGNLRWDQVSDRQFWGRFLECSLNPCNNTLLCYWRHRSHCVPQQGANQAPNQARLSNRAKEILLKHELSFTAHRFSQLLWVFESQFSPSFELDLLLQPCQSPTNPSQKVQARMHWDPL